MNRSALTIKMLNYLKANDLVSRDELAQYLETNIRNISEFKKELEIAGYDIESVSGKHGGYRLNETSLVPTIALSDEELKTLNDVKAYLKARQYAFFNTYDNALIKIKNNVREPLKSNDIVYLSTGIVNEAESELLSLVNEAKDRHFIIEFAYRNLRNDNFELRRVQPYECVYTEDGAYVLGYDITPQKKHLFKYFKLNKQRMRDIRIGKQSFLRDKEFKLENYIGKQGLFKDVYDVHLEVYGRQARLLSETNLGIQSNKEICDGILYLNFMMENRDSVIAFILSLGNECKVIKPLEIKEDIISIIKKTLLWYNN